MNQLTIALKLAIESTGNTRAQICERCGIEAAALSKYLNGKILPRKEILLQIVNGLPAKYRSQIYLAYIRDHLPQEAENYINLSEYDSDHPKPTSNTNLLPPEIEEAFTELRDLASKSPTVASSIQTLANVMLGVGLDKVE